MDKINSIIWALFYIVICALILFKSDVFATPSVFEAMEKVENAGKAAPADEFIQRPKIVYNASDLRDPFNSYIKEEEVSEDAKQSTAVFANQQVEKAPPSLTVQGLVWGGNFPQAIINNKVLRIRDTIEGATIKTIEKTGVTVVFGGREYKLAVITANSSPDNSNILGGEYEKKF